MASAATSVAAATSASSLSGTLRREDPTQLYSFDKCIGKGSYGKVYRAHPKAGGPTVAFKVLPLDEGENSISLDMQRELLSLGSAATRGW